MKLPPLTQLRQDETHRLVPSKYALEEQGALSRLAGGNSDLALLGNWRARRTIAYSENRACYPASESTNWYLESPTPTS